MIFATVGAQMPFDRFIRTLDAWAGAHPETEILAQIGTTSYVPKALKYEASIPPDRFTTLVQEADVIVAHAGIGTILTAARFGKPILVFPRRAALAETRNDHQVATARRFVELGFVHAAFDEDELCSKLDSIPTMTAATRIRTTASPELIAALRTFLFGESAVDPRPEADR